MELLIKILQTKKTKQLIFFSALLLSLLLISACADNSDLTAQNGQNGVAEIGGGEPAGTPGEAGESSEPDESAAAVRLTPDLPDRDFDGLEIRLLGRRYDLACNVRHYSETASEELSGELMNDAVFRRNSYIEEKYNVTITRIISNDGSSLFGDIRRSVNAGDNDFDAAFASIGDSSRLAQDGLLVSLHDVPYLNLSQPWWDQRSVEGLSIGGRLHFVVGDVTPWADPFTWIVVVNKDLIERYNLDDPYQLVRDNNWTFDTFYRLGSAVISDLDGDGTITRFDRRGVMSARENFAFTFVAGGESIIRKDENDLPYLAMNTARAVNVAQSIFDMMMSDFSLIVDDYFGLYNDPWFEVLRTQFRNGNGLFYMGGLEQMLIFRDLEAYIGVLPMPKFDSNQEEFHHILNAHWASSLCIPVTNDRLAETGFVLEALAAESRYTIMPALYDLTLTQRMLRDEDSAEMLDIIRASRAYDLGIIFNWGDAAGIFSGMLARGTFNFTSELERITPRVEQQIARAIERFAEN